MTQGKRILLYILGGLILAGGMFWYFNFYKKEETETSFLKRKTQETKKTICPMDGVLVDESVANRHPLAIMVENHIDARPQIGLSEASLIYEVIAEGGITRFMAMYVWGEPEKVGPVRSARSYDIDWLSEFNAFYAHVGGNYIALQQIKQYGILDLDQFKYGTQAYWRVPQAGKAVEHTMFTSTKKLWAIAEKNKWDMKGDYQSFDFKEDIDKSLRPESASLTIDFSTPNYQVKWVYDPTTNTYSRQQVKGPDIKAKNIIVQWIERSPVVSPIGEKTYSMKTIGTGKAKIFLDGKVIEGTWKKESRTSRTWFYDSSGAKIKFNRGQTWIEIVHPEISVIAK
jgi:hypothetical protein